jgi:hypothetical protein
MGLFRPVAGQLYFFTIKRRKVNCVSDIGHITLMNERYKEKEKGREDEEEDLKETR